MQGMEIGGGGGGESRESFPAQLEESPGET